MTVIKLKCTYCNQLVEEIKSYTFGDTVFSTYKCGHTITRKAVASNKKPIISADGYTPHSYQEEAYDFSVKAGFNVLQRLEMRLGKGVVTCMILDRHPELWPAVIVCKKSLINKYLKEILRWTNGRVVPQLLEKGRDIPFKSFPVFVCSYNMLGKMLPKFKAANIEPKIIIADEFQHLVNRDAQRTKAVFEAVEMWPDIIRHATSGTPFRNHAAEYFTPLNWIRPDRFHTYEHYVMDFVDVVWDGDKNRLAGIKKSAMPRFKQLTDDFIINMDREKVAPHLPKVNREIIMCQMDEIVKDAYNQNLESFLEEYNKSQNIAPGSSILKYLTMMRHLVGVAKIKSVMEWVGDFMYDTDRKLTIFVHHRDVGQRMFQIAQALSASTGIEKPLQLTSDMSVDQQTETLAKFAGKDHRLGIVSTKAFNEGTDMQFCDAFAMAEQQWSPVEEEQAEARFLGEGAISQHVDGMYFIAMKSIDELMVNIKAVKWQGIKQTLSGDTSQHKWTEQGMMKAVADAVFAQGRSGIWRA